MGFHTMSRAAAVLAGFIACADLANAALYTDADQLPTNTYDFVVVGGGTAGNVIAGRLSENPKFSVLVIEAGISNEGVPGVEVPFLAPSNLPYSSTTWNYTTVPQAALNNREIAYSKGRVLGGSSSINFLAYTRGSNAEYDSWAQMTGDQGWSWSSLAPYYLRNSRLVPPTDHHNTTGQVNPAVHGSGPVQLCVPSFQTEIDNRVLNTSKLPGSEFPFNLDINGGVAVGLGLTQSTIGNGTRSNSATAYLEPALSRKNLDVLILNTVTRLIASGSDHGAPSFRTVEFAPNSTATRSTVTARKEVVLSAGSIGTPQILLLSGIGDRASVEAVGIKSVVHLPDVGQHLQDHPILSNYWTVASNSTFDDVLRNTSILEADLARWEANRTGLFADSPVNSIGFFRMPNNASVFSQFKDPSAGPSSGHYELLFADGYGATAAPQPPTGHFLTIYSAVVTPLSVGSVTLASSDPFAFPIMDPAFFSSPFDAQVMLAAVKAARRFVSAAPWTGFVVDRFGTVGDADTDDEILAAMKDAVVSIWHPTSTARMSPRNATWGVVDTHLLVKGTSGLRVVDASVFPRIPAVHPMAAVYIVAERAADLIKQAWN